MNTIGSRTALALFISFLFFATAVVALQYNPPQPTQRVTKPLEVVGNASEHRVLEDHTIRPRPHLTSGGELQTKTVVRRQIELRFYAADGTFMRASEHLFIDTDEGEKLTAVWVDK